MVAIVPMSLGWMSNDAGALIAGETGLMRYPIPGYAVVHERGVVVFDTGLHDSLTTSSEMLGPLADIFTPHFTTEDLLASRLVGAGLAIDRVTHVVNSHLHFDHCGQNHALGGATTVLQRSEWEAAERKPRAYTGAPLDDVAAGRVELIDGPHDIFGDGTVVCLPTPGHTPGHQSLLVSAAPGGAGDQALLVGDACYLQRMLASSTLPPFGYDRDEQRRTYDLLSRHASSGVRLLFSHDVEHWDRVPPGLQTAPRASAD